MRLKQEHTVREMLDVGIRGQKEKRAAKPEVERCV